MKKIHFLYLYLLTKYIPYAHKFYFSSKLKSFIRRSTGHRSRKSSYLSIFIKKRQTINFLNKLLGSIFSLQRKSEYSIYQVNGHIIDLVIDNVPPTIETNQLQISHWYANPISMYIRLEFKSCSLFQKLFLIRSWKLMTTELILGLE